MASLWTKQEDDLFFNEDLSNQEIAFKTGRTLQAVKRRRYDLTGTYDDYMGGMPRGNAKYMTRHDKIARLYYLADMIGVKIGDSKG